MFLVLFGAFCAFCTFLGVQNIFVKNNKNFETTLITSLILLLVATYTYLRGLFINEDLKEFQLFFVLSLVKF